jgi:N-acetylglucosaminyldiphosphoundecaprenol N-acetyl-beta-D-mannosaminyltransferase
LREVQILNVTLHNYSRQELLERLQYGMLINPNVDVLMKLQADEELFRLTQRAELRICDSQILRYAAAFLGTPLRERISGSDFFAEFCAHHAHNPEIRVFLLGAAPGVAEAAQRNINARAGREVITHAHSPSFGFESDDGESARIVQRVNESGCTVLAVGVGCPKQEKWIARHRARMPAVRIFLCIGATIDFEAGIVRRAPRWMSDIGLEWLFRLLMDPRRLLKRYLVHDLPFFWLLLKQRFGWYQSPFAGLAYAEDEEAEKLKT